MQPQKFGDVAIDLRCGNQVEFRPKRIDFSGVAGRGELQADALGIGKIEGQMAARFGGHEIVSENLVIRMLHILQAAKSKSAHRHQGGGQHEQRNEKTGADTDRAWTHTG